MYEGCINNKRKSKEKRSFSRNQFDGYKPRKGKSDAKDALAKSRALQSPNIRQFDHLLVCKALQRNPKPMALSNANGI
jgi:hypothetical protein